jgi:hypothetical protein
MTPFERRYAHFPGSIVYHTLRAPDGTHTACGRPVGSWWCAEAPRRCDPCWTCAQSRQSVVATFMPEEVQDE